MEELLHTLKKEYGDIYDLPAEEKKMIIEYAKKGAKALNELFPTIDAYLEFFYDHIQRKHQYGPGIEQELKKKYEKLLQSGWSSVRKL